MARTKLAARKRIRMSKSSIISWLDSTWFAGRLNVICLRVKNDFQVWSLKNYVNHDVVY